jgi:arsenate reductase
MVNPYAIKVMAEIGIDLSKYLSKSIDKLQREKFDYVVTLCDQAKKTCPFFPNSKEYIHKNFIDPAGIEEGEDELLNIFRGVRDEIKDWIEKTFISPLPLSE